jgi:hypothetical protein
MPSAAVPADEHLRGPAVWSAQWRAQSAEASSAASQVQSDYAKDAESNWNTRDHREVVHFEQLFDRRVEGNR